MRARVPSSLVLLLAWPIVVSAPTTASGEGVAAAAPPAAPDRAARVAATLMPVVRVQGAAPVRYGLEQRMKHFPETDQGAAVMVNGDAGRPMVQEILYAIAAEYGWPDFAPRTIQALPRDAEALERAVGTYATSEPREVTVSLTRQGTRLFMDAPVLGARTDYEVTGSSR